MHRQNGVFASPEADTVIIPRRSLANPLGGVKTLCCLVSQLQFLSSLGASTWPASGYRLQWHASRAISLRQSGCRWGMKACLSNSGHGPSPARVIADGLAVSFALCL
jgi:hypothetical protein